VQICQTLQLLLQGLRERSAAPSGDISGPLRRLPPHRPWQEHAEADGGERDRKQAMITGIM